MTRSAEVPAPDLGADRRATSTAQAPSDFFNDVLASKYVKRRAPDYADAQAARADAEGVGGQRDVCRSPT